ncbi:MAG: protein kinase domain-containing protein [Planctomycetota bacterium]
MSRERRPAAFVSFQAPGQAMPRSQPDPTDPLDLDDPAIEELLNVDRELPRYEIVGHLGVGGSARTLALHDHELDRRLACKLVDGRDAESRRRWQQERQILARLSHPAILPLFDAGESEGLCWLSMPIGHGRSLQELLRAGQRLSPRAACALLAPIAEALAHAHELGVVHGDVSPANILVGEEGSPQLVDWGEACLQACQEPAAHVTADYAPPELLREGRRSPAGDQYMLAVCLQRLLNAQRRPATLCAILTTCLHKDPRDRYADTAALAADLHAVALDEPVSVRAEGPAMRAWRWARRNPRGGLVVLVSVLLTAVLGLALEHQWRQLRRDWHLVTVEDFSQGLDPEDWTAYIFPLWDRNRRERRAVGATCPWLVEDGRLVSRWSETWSGAVNITYDSLVGSDFRASWTVTGLANGRNLNVYVGDHRYDGWTIHVGGFEDEHGVVVTDYRLGLELVIGSVHRAEAFVPDRSYHCMLSLIDDRLRFHIDGELVIEVNDPFAGGWRFPQRIGFETARNSIAIDDLRIEQLARAQRIDVKRSYDQLLVAGRYDLALREYRALASTERDGWIQLQIGRCLRELGQERRAGEHLLALVRQASAARQWRLAAMLLLLQDAEPEQVLEVLLPLAAAAGFAQEQRLLIFNMLVLRERRLLTTSESRVPPERHRAYARRLLTIAERLHMDLAALPSYRLAPSLMNWARAIGSALQLPAVKADLAALHPALAQAAAAVSQHYHDPIDLEASGALPEPLERVTIPSRSAGLVSVKTLQTPLELWFDWRRRHEPALQVDTPDARLQAALADLDRLPATRSQSPQQIAVAAAMLLLELGQPEQARARLTACLEDPLAQQLPLLQEELRLILAGEVPPPSLNWFSGAVARGLIAELEGRPRQALAAYRSVSEQREQTQRLITWRIECLQQRLSESAHPPQ